ncbi:MAG: polyprenyl synthetase family protein [Hyphomicrobiaceae bacterium]
MTATQSEVESSAFAQRLGAAAEQTEARLAAILASHTDSTPERLAEAMRHATLGGGKRFRAFLVLESAGLYGANAAAALDVAAALECLHAYSLVHDDLPAMDNDLVRRGRPTVWKAYDEWTAILAGDALLTLAFEIVAGAQATAEARVALTRMLAVDAGRAGMVGGQALDLAAEKLGQPAQPDVAHVRRLQAMKTGALIRFACEAGAVLAGASQEHVAAMTAYGRALGLAFQVSDDLLDVTGDASVVGKAVGKDQSLGKATFVALAGVAAAHATLRETVAEALAALAPYGSGADALRGAAHFMLTRRS